MSFTYCFCVRSLSMLSMRNNNFAFVFLAKAAEMRNDTMLLKRADGPLYWRNSGSPERNRVHYGG